MHFSRFMVKGDEKLLFLSDIDGEVDQHIERLVESAGPVFDAIFKHVDDPPATPVASNPQGVIKWLKRHVREPLDTYFAYEDASVQDIKACARAAGFTGNTSQSPLLTYMSFKSRLQGFALKLVGKALLHEKGKEASDAIGTLHFSHWVPFENNHIGFFTIYDGDFETVHPGLRGQDLVRVRYALSTYHWRAANPSSKERPGVLSVGIGRTTIRRSGFTAPIQASRFKTFEPCWPIASHNRPPLDSSGVTWSRTMINPEVRRWPRRTKHKQPRRRRARGFFADCLVEGGTRTRRLMAIRGRRTSPRSTSRTFRGSFSAVTGCRWCGISC